MTSTGYGCHLENLLDIHADHSPLQNYIILNDRQVCDLELILSGAYAPLKTFMNQAEYNSVCKTCQINNHVFGLPVVLDININECIVKPRIGTSIILVNNNYGGQLAEIIISEMWRPNLAEDCKIIYGDYDINNPAHATWVSQNATFITGKLRSINKIERNWVKCDTPADIIARHNPDRMLIAFQTRNPIHRSHFEMIKRIAEQYDVLIHPVIGPTKDDDIDAKTRVLTYEAMRSQLPPNVFMSYLPYNMQVGGPREALQHAIIRRNYGCDGMIVGRDHAGCKNIKTGIDIYGPYDAQTFVGAYADKLTVNNHPFMFLTFSTMIYSPSLSSYIPEDEYKHIGATDGTELSGTKFRQMITSGEDIPAWYSFDTTIAILRKKTAIL